jgi:hypothetical protein
MKRTKSSGIGPEIVGRKKLPKVKQITGARTPRIVAISATFFAVAKAICVVIV